MCGTASAAQIEIYSAADLMKIGTGMNDGVNWTMDDEYFLMNSIDLSGIPFVPIGTALNPFNGSLYGNGYTISGLKIDLPDTDGVGLFGYAYITSFNDITVTDFDIHGNSAVGVLVGYTEIGSFSNCHLSGGGSGNATVTAKNNNVGGFIGESDYIHFDECSVSDVTVTAGDSGAGGFIGSNNCFYVLSNSIVSSDVGAVTVTATYCAGGFAGMISEGTNFDSTVFGAVTVTAEFYAGGFVGLAENYCEYMNCTVTGDEDYPVTISVKYSNAGGFSGGTYASTENNYLFFIDCSVSGAVTVIADVANAGGFGGESNHCMLLNCSVLSGSGAVTVIAYDGAGGFIGSFFSGEFYDCSVFGELTVTADHSAGGFVGNILVNCDFFNCTVTGDEIYPVTIIVDFDDAGGFVGFAGRYFDSNNISFYDCSVSGAVTVIANAGSAGGFAGESEYCILFNCSVSGGNGDNGGSGDNGGNGGNGDNGGNGGNGGNGAVTVIAYDGAGGFIGSLFSGYIYECSVFGDLTVMADYSAGGFIGNTF